MRDCVIHQRVHPGLDVEGCYGCKIAHFTVAASAMPTRGGDALWLAEREKRWNRDLPAYRELRRQGVQPERIDGCADLAVRASDKLEIESSTLLNKRQLSQAKDLTEAL
jgi:hypothetical protein